MSMGRIKTTLIKRTAMELLEKHEDTFKKTFEENKKLVDELAKIKTKRLRNPISGYITRLVKKQ
tara:strand:+ start:376 stop:567 length:192 start_codon:yes stop_codon:yes gene_type:complete